MNLFGIKLPVFLITLAVCILFAGCAPYESLVENKIVLGGTQRMTSDQLLDGDYINIGGNVTLDEGSTILGDVISIGGTMILNGKIQGELTSIGSNISLGEQAIVSGDATAIGGNLNPSNKTSIQGGTYFYGNSSRTPVKITVPKITIPNLVLPDPSTRYVFFFLQVLSLAVLGMLITLFFGKQVMRISGSIIARPYLAGGLGLLTAIVLPTILLVLMVTIILIPLSILGILILMVATLIGWIAMGQIIGSRLFALIKQPCASPVCTGVGTLILTLVASGIGMVPWVGFIAGLVAALVGLGGVFISGFGTQTSKLTSFK